ncbi:hypothetical protein KAT36_02250 [Candidatus Pacearchaeota archaeon]|nr:hypothetical protein [Candidatus Pacearchaeota archaeon]
MKKNAQLHLLVETRFVAKLKKEAEECNTGFSEYCRKKLWRNPQLDRIERKLDKLIGKRKKGNKRLIDKMG